MFLVTDLLVLLGANLILVQALGISTIFVAAGNRKNLICTAMAITVFTTIGSAGACAVDSILPKSAADLRLLLYVIVIGAVYICILTGTYMLNRKFFESVRRYIHISAFNCAVMGTLLSISGRAYDTVGGIGFKGYILGGLEAGFGFIITALMLLAAYRKLNSSKVPAAFRGFPAMLVYLGIISMAVFALR